jgi:hypothetical protein
MMPAKTAHRSKRGGLYWGNAAYGALGDIKTGLYIKAKNPYNLINNKIR